MESGIGTDKQLTDEHLTSEPLTDEQLVLMSRSGDAEATDRLLRQFKPLVLKLSRARFLAGGERDDLIQEGMIGLYKAIRDYDETKDTKFMTFAALCVDRQMLHAIESSLREKNRVLNDSVLLGEDALGGMEPSSDLSPEAIMIAREMADERLGRLKESLSPMERRVLDLYLSGLSIREIAEVMKKTPKSVDNAFQRIRKKTLKQKKADES